MAENPNFDNAACEELIQQARTSSLTITPSLWVKRTHAIGMTVKQGKGGGVTAYSENVAEVFGRILHTENGACGAARATIRL